MLRCEFVLLLTLAVVGGLWSSGRQVAVSDPASREVCGSVQALELPAGDRPASDERASLAGCSSVDLYFGFGGKADPVRARKCAYLELEAGEKAPALGGAAILMMTYANGKGAARSFDLALKLACSIPGAPQDVAGRVGQLARLRAANWTGEGFSICDHSSGRALYVQCAILQDRFDAADRARDLAAVTAGWTAAERSAFVPLKQAADRFFRAHAGREVNLDATVEVQERAFLENDFIRSLQRFDEGDTPRFSAEERREAEAAMQAAYARTQADKSRRWGTVTVEAIRDTQRLWLAYRDAWLAFAKVKYPAVTRASWQTWLAEERAETLRRFDLT